VTDTANNRTRPCCPCTLLGGPLDGATIMLPPDDFITHRAMTPDGPSDYLHSWRRSVYWGMMVELYEYQGVAFVPLRNPATNQPHAAGENQ